MTLWSDVRSAFRSIRRGRFTTLLALLAFALGIGITVAVFTLFYGVLFKPLPYPEPDRLVMVYDVQPACKTCPASYEKYLDWSTRNQVFAVLGGSYTPLVVVTGLGDPERVLAARVTQTLVDVFGIAPARGRWFTRAEDTAGGPKVVVLSDGYWRRKFAGDPHALGQTMSIDGEPHQIIGVMPVTFSHRRAELFMPLARAFDAGHRGSHFLTTYGRLKPGVTVDRARQDMAALGETLKKEFGHNHGIDVVDYYRAVVGTVVDPLRVLMGAVGLVLVIACANVANLLLASGLARRRELAIRTALGATRWNVARQLVAEAILLAMAGGALGLLLAWWCVTVFVKLAGNTLPRATSVSIDGTVVLVTCGLSLLVGAACALWPVVRICGGTLVHDVREGDLRTGRLSGSRRFGDGLVVVEVALAFSLLVGAGVLVKNLMRLERQDTGFTTDRLITFDLAPNGPRYQDPARLRFFYADLAAKLAGVPGVTNLGLTSHLPMYQFGWNGEVTLEGGNPWQPNDAPLVEDRWVGGEYFRTMGISIVRGRAFDARDAAESRRVTIISERAAEKFWPGQDPIGRRLHRGGPGSPLLEVVGVAHDVLTFGLTAKAPYELYVPITQEPFAALTVVLRTDRPDSASVMPGVRQVVGSLDPMLPVSRVQTMGEVVSKSVSQPRLISSLTTLFGGLASLLAVVGVYGLLAYNVRRERPAFAIRLALGAEPREIRAIVLGRSLRLAGLGIALGAAAALGLTRTLQALVTDVKVADPAVFMLTAAGFLALAVLAGALPAFLAARTDPLVLLRSE